jgi:hypothetical protein
VAIAVSDHGGAKAVSTGDRASPPASNRQVRGALLRSWQTEDVMVLERRRARGDFHAILRQVERGLFRADYSAEINPENPDEREILDYHLGTSATEVKIWVEQMALGQGYQRVVWDELPPEAAR